VSNGTGAGSLSSSIGLNQISSVRSKDPVFCIAVHPMGLQIAAGFKEKLKIFYLLEDEVKAAIEYVSKICLCAKYSNGGQYLAAANGNLIQIIDPYTFEIKYQLTGHPSFVRILQWNESDSMLLSVCNNGSAYGWTSNFDVYNKDK
jgi:WD40 repeat protein